MRNSKVKQLRKITRKITGKSPTKSNFRRIKKDYSEHKIKINQIL
jgi:hypothetical protein